MAKHSSGDTADAKDYQGKHRASGAERTAGDRREDVGADGRVTGWAVGREGRPDNYTDR